MGKVVCVTGASGYIASWLVKLLLHRGYTVKATVRNLSDPNKVEHLKALEGAQERLELFEAELTKQGSFDAAIDACECVFHTASPVHFESNDPQNELIIPAVNGTINVLKSCKKVASIKRVVLTSSIASIMANRAITPHTILDETWYTDPIFCAEIKEWYALSKTLAEEAAWKFAEENGIDLVTINPGYVLGPVLQPTINFGTEGFIDLIKEGKELLSFGIYNCVDVRDVGLAHILAFENPCAKGRYLMVERAVYMPQMLEIVKKIYPFYILPTIKSAEERPMNPSQPSKEKMKSLGFTYTPLEVTLKDTIESLKEKKLMSF